MRACFLILLLLAPAWSQGTPAKKGTGKKLAALPEGKTRIFEAVVIGVAGTAQARATSKDKWRKLAVNDVLKPGAVVRTGRKSHVALRVGPNASMLIERQSRVQIPEIVQKGKVLRTRVTMSFGKTDVRVDRVGLDNDFEVATPTATLAVRGTTFRIDWNAVSGFKAVGVRGNKLRAIELGYLQKVAVHLSKADASSEEYRLPAINGYYETYFLPLKGAIGESEMYDPTQAPPDYLNNPAGETGLDAARKQRGGKQGLPRPGKPPPTTDNPPQNG